MKGVTVYSGKFAVWHTRLRDELPDLEGTDNPMLWFGKCLLCRDIIVCGVDTKQECVAVMEQHVDLDECDVEIS